MKLAAVVKLSAFFTAFLLLIGFTASTVAAHGGDDWDLWRSWAWDDLPLLLLIGGMYALGLQSLWRRAGSGSGIQRWQAGAFALGWSVLLGALVSPVDALSEQLFSAHMVQHLLIVLIAAPLFVLGRFPVALSWAMPPSWSTGIWNKWKWKQLWKILTRPVTAGLLHAGAIWYWHMPQPYQAAILNEWFHFLEHASFFLTAFLFWQVFADLTDEVRFETSAKVGLGIFYVFAIMLVSGFLGVLIAFSPSVWYPIHIHQTASFGLTPLEDQHLAGTLMWVPAGIVYVGAAIGVLGRWLFTMERAETGHI